jgi:tRNA U54 and U55 pseudouridine synthase Pus10
VDVKVRDACRIIRALRKISYEIRGPWKGKPKKEEKKVYKAFITLEDQVAVHHLRHRVGRREELQTTLSHPHQFRKTLIRVYRLKNLRWSLLHVDREGNRARMAQLMQILEEDAEYVLVIEDQKRKRANASGTSKRRHFERANQKRGRGDFQWSPPQEKDSHKK